MSGREIDIDDGTTKAMMANPTFQQLTRSRATLGWTLAAIMWIIYFGFILLVAFNKTDGMLLSGKITGGFDDLDRHRGRFRDPRRHLRDHRVLRRDCQFPVRSARPRAARRGCFDEPSRPSATMSAVLLPLGVTTALAQAQPAPAAIPTSEPFNYPALVMFFLFVALTLYITARAASGNKSAAQFYAAGGGITGFQNGLAIAGDYMSRPRSSASPASSTPRASTGCSTRSAS